MILSLAVPVFAETYYTPNFMQISQLEAYKNVLELNDQAYLVNFGIGMTANITPSTPIDNTYIFRLSESGVLKSTETAYGFYQDGYGDNVSQSGIAWIYFPAGSTPTWSGNITIAFEGNPTLTWSGSVPSVSSNIFSLWFNDGTIAGTSTRLTDRIKYIAQQLETEWGVDLIDITAVDATLTTYGEEYFSNTIPNLRTICPDLFSEYMSSPTFPEDVLVLDYFVGENSGAVAVVGLTQYAQTFTATDEYIMTGVQVPVYRVGTPSTLTVYLRNVAGGIPIIGNLASGTYNADTLTTDTDGQWIDVAFTADYTLTAGNTYAIVLDAVGAGVGESVSWLHDTSNRYTTGTECSNIGGLGWVAVGANDCMFELLVRSGAGLSFGHRYEMRLLGTIFDVSQIATNWGMSNMMVSTLIWIAVIVVIIVAIVFATRSMDTWWIIFCFLAAYGWRAGFADTYLLVGVILVSSIVMFYSFWYKRTN